MKIVFWGNKFFGEKSFAVKKLKIVKKILEKKKFLDKKKKRILENKFFMVKNGFL